MISHDFTPRGVCARSIHVDLSDDGKVVESVSFVGGCNGMPVDRVVELLQGNTCGPRSTSCADQLTLALREAAAEA